MLHDKNGLGQATGENALVQAGILVAEVQEEGVHRIILVALAVEVDGEAASGDDIRDLGLIARYAADRTADTSDPGTCEITAVR